jgi:hypothetical protein
MSSFPFRWTGLALSAILLNACDGEGTAPSGTDSEIPRPIFESVPTPYALQDGRMVLDNGIATSDTSRHCTSRRIPDGLVVFDSLVEKVSPPTRHDTLLTSLEGDELTLYFVADTSGDNFVSATKYRRIGTGSGLQGEWRAVEYRLRVDGAWSSHGRIDLSEAIDSRLILTADSYRSVDRELLSWASTQILRWNRVTLLDSAQTKSFFYDIEVTQVDPETVRYRGLSTGEIVIERRIRKGKNSPYSGDVQISSSDTTHPTFVVKEVVESCPIYPEWYQHFWMNNAKSLP